MNDPINPAHYAGTACAEIGERLSGNSYQVLKYNWRLGKKDAAHIEVGKSIWYLDREIELGRGGWRYLCDMPTHDFFIYRLIGVDEHVFSVAHSLINWCRYGDVETLVYLRATLSKLHDAYVEHGEPQRAIVAEHKRTPIGDCEGMDC